MSDNAKVFVGVRIPKDIITAIHKLIKDTKKSQTDIIIELLQRGLDSIKGVPLTDVSNPLDVVTFQAAIAKLESLIKAGNSATAPIEPVSIDVNREAATVFYDVLSYGLSHDEMHQALNDGHSKGWIRQQSKKGIVLDGVAYHYIEKAKLWFPETVLPVQ